MKHNDLDILSLVGYVKISKNRYKILNQLENNPQMPSELAKNTKLERNYVSNLLKQLQSKELIECVNPEDRKGRVYIITSKGEEVSNYLKHY